MRITLLCNKDLASCVALNYLLPALASHDVSVLMSARVGGQSKVDSRPAELLQLQFYEQQLFNDILFPLLAVSHCHKQTQLRSFTQLSDLYNVPMRELNGINTPEGLKLVASQTPDLMLSVRYGAILKEAVLAIPKIGVLNLHSGLLPAYKGVMATFRALLQGDSEIGTTLHWIDDSSIDTGRIITKTAIPVVTGKSYLWHVLALYEGGCKPMVAAVDALSRGESIESTPQPAGGNYFSFPTTDELKAFDEAGWKLVDAKEIEQLAKRFMQ